MSFTSFSRPPNPEKPFTPDAPTLDLAESFKPGGAQRLAHVGVVGFCCCPFAVLRRDAVDGE